MPPRPRRPAEGDLERRWRTRSRSMTRAQGGVRATTVALVRTVFGRLNNPYSPVDEEAWARAAADATRRGRRRTSALTVAGARAFLTDAGVEAPRVGGDPTDTPRGLALEEEFRRATAQFRWDLERGTEPEQAAARALTRAETIADTSLALAERDGFAEVFSAAPDVVVGYRRVLHPELSRGGTCGLCIAAATRVYRKTELMPLHTRCHCTQLPVLDGEQDLALKFNDQDLIDLYVEIGETGKKKLAQARYRLVDHGEIGPWLVAEGQQFRGSDDVRREARAGTPIGEGPGAGDGGSASGEPQLPEQRTAADGAGGRPPGDGPPAPAGADEPERPLVLPRGPEAPGLPTRAEVEASSRYPAKEPVSFAALDEDGLVRDGDAFGTDEAAVAAWLIAAGVPVVPVERTSDRTPDAALRGAGLTVEFKTLVSARAIDKALRRARGQSGRIVIDARNVALDRETAIRELAAALLLRGAGVEEVLVIGADYVVSWP